MLNEMKNDDCRKECRDCVYYFEETDFCLHCMYNVKGTVENCPNKKSKADYVLNIFIKNIQFKQYIFFLKYLFNSFICLLLKTL